MKYENAVLVAYTDTDEKDALGNAVQTRIELLTVKARATQWTADDVTTLGRDVTETNRKVLLIGSVGAAKTATHLYIDGHDYKITSVQDLARWTFLIVKKYR